MLFDWISQYKYNGITSSQRVSFIYVRVCVNQIFQPHLFKDATNGLSILTPARLSLGWLLFTRASSNDICILLSHKWLPTRHLKCLETYKRRLLIASVLLHLHLKVNSLLQVIWTKWVSGISHLFYFSRFLYTQHKVYRDVILNKFSGAWK